MLPPSTVTTQPVVLGASARFTNAHADVSAFDCVLLHERNDRGLGGRIRAEALEADRWQAGRLDASEVPSTALHAQDRHLVTDVVDQGRLH
jgi:hypothetical protein